MLWGKYFSLFSLSTFKFMFSPFAGVSMHLSFLETYLICISGATTCATFFFYTSDFFIKRTQRRRKEKMAEAIAKALPYKRKKSFTWSNKLIIRIQKTFGIYGICLWVPLFLSIPVGSIIVAKFYGKNKRAFPLVFFGILLNGFIITILAYSKQLAA